MKNPAPISYLTALAFLGFACQEDNSDPAVEPQAVAPILPETPIQPVNTPPINASNSATELAALPASGVPLGFATWDEINTVEPEQRSLAILDGSDPSRELLGEDPLCSVYVLAAYQDERGLPTFVLRTSFKHNNESHAWIRLNLEKDAVKVLGTDSVGQNQIFLQLAEPGNFLSATRMNLKWFHINHFDTGVCENLKLRTVP